MILGAMLFMLTCGLLCFMSTFVTSFTTIHHLALPNYPLFWYKPFLANTAFSRHCQLLFVVQQVTEWPERLFGQGVQGLGCGRIPGICRAPSGFLPHTDPEHMR